MAVIELKQVHKAFGSVSVIGSVDLTIPDGEFVIFVGPSGSGKSTLLRLIAGLEETTSGAILIDGKDVTNLGPAERGLSMVFQSYALYPHKSVRGNMSFGLEVSGMPKAEIRSRVDAVAKTLQLEAYLDRKPKELSGGQRQRVAIGRAIVRDPVAFMFDEPLSNLDASLRVDMRLEIAKLHQQLGATMVYVTHDQVEAMTLADKIVVLRDGAIQQVGSPIELYERPANLFVAQFLGSPKMNVLPVRRGVASFSVGGHGEIALPGVAGEIVNLGVRPEAIALANAGEGNLSGTIDVVERLGSDTFSYVNVGDGHMVTVRIPGNAGVRTGEKVGMRFDPAHLHLFDSAGLVVRP